MSVRNLSRGERAFPTGPLATAEMKSRTHFAHRIDMLDAAGEIQEHLAGVEDYILATTYWPKHYGARQSRGGRAQPSFCGRARELFRIAGGLGPYDTTSFRAPWPAGSSIPLEFPPVRNATDAAVFAQYGPLFLRPNQWRHSF
jgi:hypothetical protein